MNKRSGTIGAIGGMAVGSVLPWLWGDYNSFGFMSVLCGFCGGLLGIVGAVWLSRLFS